jgi:hypothetical protein
MNDEFNLERAIAGEPVETISGTPAEFIAYRPTVRSSKQLIMQVGTDICSYNKNGKLYNNPSMSCSLDLRMKSVVKQIDWSKLPVDTRIIRNLCTGKSERYFSYFSGGMVYFYRDGTDSKTAQSNSFTLSIDPSIVQIAPNQPWTVWQGGECPIPDGLKFEYMTHKEPWQVMVGKESASAYLYLWGTKLIYAYRLTGNVLDGWKL